MRKKKNIYNDNKIIHVSQEWESKIKRRRQAGDLVPSGAEFRRGRYSCPSQATPKDACNTSLHPSTTQLPLSLPASLCPPSFPPLLPSLSSLSPALSSLSPSLSSLLPSLFSILPSLPLPSLLPSFSLSLSLPPSRHRSPAEHPESPLKCRRLRPPLKTDWTS